MGGAGTGRVEEAAGPARGEVSEAGEHRWQLRNRRDWQRGMGAGLVS